MKEARGNMWDFDADAYVITTNGVVVKTKAKKFPDHDGSMAVMGKGCALEAANKFPWLPFELGHFLNIYGNHVFNFHYTNYSFGLFTFPVKDEWWKKAKVKLIEQSAKELVDRVNIFRRYDSDDSLIILPRPGCGAGGLDWEDVKPIISSILDDRFTVVTF